MLFSSLTYIFIFLGLLLISYFIFKNRTYRNIILLIFSLLFYAWGEPKNIIIMLITILISYIFGLIINYLDIKEKYKLKKIIFILSIITIISSLLYFKYTNFIIKNINSLFTLKIPLKNIILPIGISFYTFQILSYLIDLYKKEIKVQKNIFKLALYVTLFPQLIAGPIVRYQTVENELSNRKENLNDFINGLKRFIIGLSKKVIIANQVAVLADLVFDNLNTSYYGSIIYWIGALAYTLQIYYDFSGYSDMAIGIGEMFGFHFLENFNYPYIALSITDFWRRWHISLSSWFRDYIYIPLGGNRVAKWRFLLNILIVWSLTGLWHGASYNFIAWGLYFAIILLIEKLLIKKMLTKLPKIVSWFYTAFLVIIGWVIFRLESFKNILYYIKKMFDFSNTKFNVFFANNSVIIPTIFIIIGLIFIFPIYPKLKRSKSRKINIILDLCYIGLFIFCIILLISSKYNPFIYFRF